MLLNNNKETVEYWKEALEDERQLRKHANQSKNEEVEYWKQKRIVQGFDELLLLKSVIRYAFDEYKGHFQGERLTGHLESVTVSKKRDVDMLIEIFDRLSIREHHMTGRLAKTDMACREQLWGHWLAKLEP